MMFLLKAKTWPSPLTFFQIHGTLCCTLMHQEYEKFYFTNYLFCYEAKTIYESNTLVLWGSMNNKLINIIHDQINNLINKKFIIHIKGCSQRIDNNHCHSSLINFLPINKTLSDCQLKKDNYQSLITEARKCLRA